MKYSPERISSLLGLNVIDKAVFLSRIEEPNDSICIKYRQGLAIADFKLDRVLQRAGQKGDVLAITELGTRQYHRRMDDLKKELLDS